MGRPMKKKIKAISALIVVLTAEKILQHFLSALAFIGLFPGVPTPDIGMNFAISNSTMALLNLFFTLLFVIGLFGITRQLRWGMPLVIAISALDIILEFLFHGLLYITVSVIVSTILIIIITCQMRTKRGYTSSIAK
jgi:hypothetical protein